MKEAVQGGAEELKKENDTLSYCDYRKTSGRGTMFIKNNKNTLRHFIFNHTNINKSFLEKPQVKMCTLR